MAELILIPETTADNSDCTIEGRSLRVIILNKQRRLIQKERSAQICTIICFSCL